MYIYKRQWRCKVYRGILA